jgi:hypothetical protein
MEEMQPPHSNRIRVGQAKQLRGTRQGLRETTGSEDPDTNAAATIASPSQSPAVRRLCYVLDATTRLFTCQRPFDVDGPDLAAQLLERSP